MSGCSRRSGGRGMGGLNGTVLGYGCGWIRMMMIWLLVFTSGARCFTIEQPANAIVGERTTITYLQALIDPITFTVDIVNAQGVTEASFPSPPSIRPANGDALQISLTLGTSFPPGTGYTYQFFALNSVQRLATSPPFAVAPLGSTTTATTTASTSSSSTSSTTTTSSVTSMVMSMSMTTLSGTGTGTGTGRGTSTHTSTSSTSTSTGSSSGDTGNSAATPSSVNGAVIAVAIILALLVLALLAALAFYLSRRKRGVAEIRTNDSGTPGWWPRGKRSMFIAHPWSPPSAAPHDEEKGGVRLSYAGGDTSFMAGQAEMAEAEASLGRNTTVGATEVSRNRTIASSNVMPMPDARASSAIMSPTTPWMPPSPAHVRQMREKRDLTVAVGAPDHRVSLPVTATSGRTFSIVESAVPPPLPLQAGLRPSWIARGPATPKTPRVVWTLSMAGLTSTTVPGGEGDIAEADEGESSARSSINSGPSTPPSDTGAVVPSLEDEESLDPALREYDVASVHNSLETRSQGETSARQSLDTESFRGRSEYGESVRGDSDDDASIESSTPLTPRAPSVRTPAPPTTARQGPFRFSLASNSLPFTPTEPVTSTTARRASDIYYNFPTPPRSPLPDSATFGPASPSGTRRESLVSFPRRESLVPFPASPPPAKTFVRQTVRPLPALPIIVPPTAPSTPSPFTPSASSARPTRPPLPAIPSPSFPTTARPDSDLLTPLALSPGDPSTRASIMSTVTPVSSTSMNDIRGAEVLLAHWQSMQRTDRRLTVLDESGQRRNPSQSQRPPLPPTAEERW